MVFATVLAGVLAFVAFGAWRVLQARRMALGNWVGAVALAVWLVVVGAIQLFEQPQGHSELVRSMDSLAWPTTAESPLVRPAAAELRAAGTAGVGAAPVESLIGRLEARLAAQPDDAKGWALLAQSYAYTADKVAVERAVQRAVALGVDEQSLRESVQGAARSVHSNDEVGRSLRAGSP